MAKVIHMDDFTATRRRRDVEVLYLDEMIREHERTMRIWRELQDAILIILMACEVQVHDELIIADQIERIVGFVEDHYE